MTSRTRTRSAALLAATSLLALTACSGGDTGTDGGDGGDGGETATTGEPVEVAMWTHNAGNEVELELVTQTVDDYNASQGAYKIVIEAFPQESYNDAIVSAAASESLPCILDVDGPVVPSWAYAGYLAPLDLDPALTDTLLTGVKGVYDDTLYSAGFYDAALGILGRKSVLDALGIRIPTTDAPWTLKEFDAALVAMKASGQFEYALDWGTGWTGEWFPYAYSPLLQSFGGDLVDRDGFRTADGVLNGEEGVAWGEWFQSTFTDGYANPKGSSDRTEFLTGTIGLQYNGSWGVPAAVETFGEDLLVLPPVDLGAGPAIGAGSWQWAGSSSCETPEAVNEWLTFALQDKYLTQFSEDLGTLPATETAAAMGTKFVEGAVTYPFLEFSQEFAIVRPETPAYPFIAKVFEEATADIINGADVRNALNAAVDEIDTNLADNGYYE